MGRSIYIETTLSALIAGLLVLSCHQSALADAYKRSDHGFYISAVSHDEVKQTVIDATLLPKMPPDLRGVLARWRLMPCYNIRGANSGEVTNLLKLFETLDRRSGFRMNSCGAVSSVPSLTYFFGTNPNDPSTHHEILDLLGSPENVSNTLAKFLSGRSVCYWNFNTVETPARAVILVNRSAAGEPEEQQCLFAGTMGTSGIPEPIGVAGQGVSATSDEWQIAVELNLLALFVIYDLPDEVAAGTGREVVDAIGAAIDDMRVPLP